MSAGKTLPALHDDVWVPTAAQLQVHLTIWETAIEEVWPWPEAGDEQTEDRFRLLAAIMLGNIIIRYVVYNVYLPTTSLMTLVKTPFSTRVKVTAG